MGAVKYVAQTPKRVIGRVRRLVDRTLADGPMGTIEQVKDEGKGIFHDAKGAVSTLGDDVTR